jgi:indole-3-glycerol phosphate synthase
MGFLSEVVERVRGELRDRPAPDRELLARARDGSPPLDFAGPLAGSDVSLIAEIKRSSPSAGPIARADPGEQAERYERGGAAAISVLTEPRHFGGSGQDLQAARGRTSLPILRKDFVVDRAQVIEARAWGADAVLLIAEALSDEELSDLVKAAEEFGMAALVEAYGREGVERAVATGSRLLGVNARDLETLGVDFPRALSLAREVPPDRILVLESGIFSRDQVTRAGEAGARAVLVGEALMRSDDPEGAIRDLLGLTRAQGQAR